MMDLSATPACRQPKTRRLRTLCRHQRSRSVQYRWLRSLAFRSSSGAPAVIQLWLGIFAVNWRKLPRAEYLDQQISQVRARLQGTYSELLTAMVLNPALQLYLNGPANHRDSPNENLARELLELFSLGQGNYAEADVREAARALTGYRVGTGPIRSRAMVKQESLHDAGLKTVLGRRAPFDAVSLVSWLAQQPATATNILGRVWRDWIGQDPDPARVSALAAQWRQQDLSLPWLYDTLSKQPETLLCQQYGRRLLDPITLVTRTMKLLGSRDREVFVLGLKLLRRMGQAPFEPPTVEGWPSGVGWLSHRWLLARRRGLLQLLGDEEIWASRQLPDMLSPDLVPFQPQHLSLPAPPSRENLALLLADPSWQFSGPLQPPLRP